MQYQIQGGNLPVVICTLENGERMISERGSMSWMSPNMHMDTSSNGGIGKALGRMFAGEALFQNIYTAQGGQGMIAFASSFPGSIRALQISAGNGMIVQKRAFLAAESGVELSIHFQKRFSSGLFGGEGFIMQRLSGQGMAFIEIDGSAVEYRLAAGQSLLIDTGHLAAMSESCTMQVETVPGIKNVFFGGEGLFLTRVTGPGNIILQTMPIPNVAASLIPYLPNSNN
jgi:uncharacterized protein (TIGR00266 family)